MIDWLVSVLEIPGEDDIIRYGLEQGISSILGIIVALVMGFKIGIFLESCIFITMFIPLRVYAGGYHANTRWGCAAVSFLLLLFQFFCIKNWAFSLSDTLAVGLVESTILYFLVSVPEKSVQEPIECIVFKKRGRRVLFAEVVFLISAVFLKCDLLARPIVAMFSMMLILILLGNIKILIGKANEHLTYGGGLQ